MMQQFFCIMYSQGKWKKYPPKNLYTNVQISIILNSKKVETTQILSTDEQINKILSFHKMDYSSIKKNGVLIHPTTWMSLENIGAVWKRPYTKDHVLYDSIYRNSPEEANPQRQKVQWLPGFGDKGKGSFGDDWIDSVLKSGWQLFTTLRI